MFLKEQRARVHFTEANSPKNKNHHNKNKKDKHKFCKRCKVSYENAKNSSSRVCSCVSYLADLNRLWVLILALVEFPAPLCKSPLECDGALPPSPRYQSTDAACRATPSCTGTKTAAARSRYCRCSVTALEEPKWRTGVGFTVARASSDEPPSLPPSLPLISESRKGGGDKRPSQVRSPTPGSTWGQEMLPQCTLFPPVSTTPTRKPSLRCNRVPSPLSVLLWCLKNIPNPHIAAAPAITNGQQAAAPTPAEPRTVTVASDGRMFVLISSAGKRWKLRLGSRSTVRAPHSQHSSSVLTTWTADRRHQSDTGNRITETPTRGRNKRKGTLSKTTCVLFE